MTSYFPIVFEREDSGAVSAYVPGLPVYAAADTHQVAERAIRETLDAYLEAHPDATAETIIRVARVSGTPRRRSLDIVGVAALLGGHRSRAKARAVRKNGALGGRPRR